MSRRVPSGPSPRVTGRTAQITIRLPLDLYEEISGAGRLGARIAAEMRALRHIATTTTDPAAASTAREALQEETHND